MILRNLKSLIRRYPVAVVLYHYLKTARINPAETLKNE